MDRIQELLDDFTARSRHILGDNLTGIYLHGSAVMGCFNPEKSDIDLILVVKDEVNDTAKKQFMDMVVELNKQAPEKGLELSIVREAVCKSFELLLPYCIRAEAVAFYHLTLGIKIDEILCHFLQENVCTQHGSHNFSFAFGKLMVENTGGNAEK